MSFSTTDITVTNRKVLKAGKVLWPVWRKLVRCHPFLNSTLMAQIAYFPDPPVPPLPPQDGIILPVWPGLKIWSQSGASHYSGLSLVPLQFHVGWCRSHVHSPAMKFLNSFAHKLKASSPELYEVYVTGRLALDSCLDGEMLSIHPTGGRVSEKQDWASFTPSCPKMIWGTVRFRS